MDFLNKGYAQVADVFKAMTPGARLTAGLLLIVAGVSVAYLFNQQAAGPDAYLMGGERFLPNQLAHMQAALGKAGLECLTEGNRIKVPRGQEAKYMAALAEANALPADFGQYRQRALSTNNFWTNRTHQEALYKSAHQQDLQDIINQMQGVEKSAVQIAEQTTAGLKPKKIVKASVSIQPKGNQPLDPAIVASIRNLMAGAVEGLQPEAVTVVDLRAGRSYAGTGGHSKNGSMVGDYADYKQRYEHDWQETIQDLLGNIPGVVVRVNVELDTEVSNEKTSIEYDGKPVVYESTQTTGTKVVEGGGPGGRPGLAAQNGVANTGAVVNTGSTVKNNDESEHTQERSAVPTTQQRIVKEGRTPKRVTVSVVVPDTYYDELWRKRNPTADGQPDKKPDATALADMEKQLKDKIESLIVTLLPLEDRTANAYPQVTVSTLETIAGQKLPEPTAKDNALAWLNQYWSTLGMSGLAFVSLLMLRSMVRSTPSNSTAGLNENFINESPATAFSMVSDELPQEPIENTARGRLKRRTAGGPSLQDELADIVREDPEAAVSILRTWIGNAS